MVLLHKSLYCHSNSDFKTSWLTRGHNWNQVYLECRVAGQWRRKHKGRRYSPPVRWVGRYTHCSRRQPRTSARGSNAGRGPNSTQFLMLEIKQRQHNIEGIAKLWYLKLFYLFLKKYQMHQSYSIYICFHQETGNHNIVYIIISTLNWQVII